MQCQSQQRNNIDDHGRIHNFQSTNLILIINNIQAVVIFETMDFGQLQDHLDLGGYVPTVGKPASKPKSLFKSDSVKSIEHSIAPSVAPSATNQRPRSNMFDTIKDTKKQTTTFQDFFKNQSSASSNQQQQQKPPNKPSVNMSLLQTRPLPRREDLNINNLLDDDDALSVTGAQRMKPPLNRRDDSKSVAGNRTQQVQSVISIAQPRRNNFDFNVPKIPQEPNLVPPLPIVPQRTESRSPLRPAGSQAKQVKLSVDNSELKKMLQQQLSLQRQFNQKLLKEQQQAHKSQIESLKNQHAEEIKRKLQLKDFEIQKLKEYHALQLKSRTQRNGEIKQIQSMGVTIKNGIQALQRAQKELKHKSMRIQQEREIKENKNRVLEDYYRQKQQNIKRYYEQLEARQRDFKQEKQRALLQLEKDRKRVEERERLVAKKQKEMEQSYIKKEKKLIQEYEQKSKLSNEEQSKVRLQKMQLQQQKLKLSYEKQDLGRRQVQFQQNRNKIMEQLQAQRTKSMTREVEINHQLRMLQTKQSQFSSKEKQLLGKMRLVQLERKQIQASKNPKQMANNLFSYTTTSFQGKSKEGKEAGALQKSIKQLKDQYLRNLGHI